MTPISMSAFKGAAGNLYAFFSDQITRVMGGGIPLRSRAARLGSSFGCFLVILAVSTPTGVSATESQAGSGLFLPERARAQAPQGAQDLCARFSWACARGGQASVIPSSLLPTIRQVNSSVNRSVRSIEDSRQYGVPEHWALPTRRGGDCEDFALLKMRELIEQGVPANSLLLATALDRRGGSHAVLIVRTDQGDLVLDNLTNSIRDWRSTGCGFGGCRRKIFLRQLKRCISKN